MRNICLLSSENAAFFKSVASYFYVNNDVNLTCIFDDEEILKDEYFSNFKNINLVFLPKEEVEGYLKSNEFDLCAIYDYKAPINCYLSENFKILTLFKSLLPAFNDSKNPVIDAFNYGVRVSGITILSHSYSHMPKIILQYPFVISEMMHFDEFEQGINNLANLIYPVVIDKFSSNELFAIQDLFDKKTKNNSCSGSCSNCGNCKHQSL